MKNVSEKFKKGIKEYGRQIDVVITYSDENGNHILDTDSLFSVTPTVNGNILKSVMKQLDFESTIKVPKDTIVNVKFGIQIDLSITVAEVNAMMVNRLDSIPVNLLTPNLKGFEYIDFGNYIVSKEPEYNADTESYSHTCYDKMLYAMKDYIKLDIEYPITIREYISKTCEHLGLEFKDKNNTFANYNREIKTDLYDGYQYTFRDILDELAQATASTICINENTDKLEIRYLKDTNSSIDEDYLKDVNIEFGERYGPINSIVLSRSGESDNVYLKDDDSIAQNGLCELKIIDNQIMNDNDRSDFLSDILLKLNGLTYYINNFDSPGITWYELCDKYSISIADKTYPCVLFNDEIKITQGLEETIYTEKPEETKTDYDKADKTDRRINQAYMIVDKQNKKIEALTGEVDKNTSKISEHTQTIEGFKDTVTKVEEIEGNIDAKVEGITNEKVDNKMKNYPTKTEMNSTINQKAESITQSVNQVKTQTITKVEVMYALSSSEATAPTSGWSTTAPQWQSGKYMWQKTINTYGNGTTDESEPTCISGANGKDGTNGVNGTNGIDGADGKGVQELVQQYYLSTSNTTQTGGSWKETQDEWSSGKYIWTRNKITWTNNTTTYTTPILATGINQANQKTAELKVTTDNISSTVSNKVGKDEIISKINQSAEDITINANKINIAGKAVNFTTNIDAGYTYTSADAERAFNIALGIISPTTADKEKLYVYDGNKITSTDAEIIHRAVTQNNGKISGTFQIDPYSTKRCIIIKDYKGNIVTSMGLYGIKTNSLTAGRIETTSMSASTIVKDENEVLGQKTLYENSSGTTGTVSFNSGEYASDYDYIEIFYKDTENGSPEQFVKVTNPNGKTVSLQVISPQINSATDKQMRTNAKKVTINSSSITTNSNAVAYVTGLAYYDTNEIAITKVVGYK